MDLLRYGARECGIRNTNTMLQHHSDLFDGRRKLYLRALHAGCKQ